MAVTSVPLVLSRLTPGQTIVSVGGGADPAFSQLLNKSFANILASFAALQSQEADLASQQAATSAATTAVADAVVTLAQLQGQVAAVQNVQTSTGLALSYTSPAVVLSSTTSAGVATISVAEHTRHYGDGTSVSVAGGTISGPIKGAAHYVWYSDLARAGGAVSYQTSDDPSAVAQLSGTHCLGSVYVSSGDGENSGTGNYGPGVSAPAPVGSVA